jgi:ribosomal-protein-alanine N-acetyltransferase
MGEPFTTRSASIGDLDHLQRIESVGMTDPWSLRLLTEELDRTDSHLLVAVRGPALDPVAYVALRYVHHEGEILRLVVEPASRNRGIAKGLLAAALGLLAGAGIRSCFLEVREDNHPALGLYRGFGFRITRRRPSYYRDGAAALVLAAVLPTPDHGQSA